MHLKKKIAAAFVSAVTLCSALPFSQGYSAEDIDVQAEIRGDINADGQLTTEDIMILGHCLTKKAFLESGDEYAADVNGDGVFNIFDIIQLKRLVEDSRIVPPTEPTEPVTEPTTEPVQTTTEVTTAVITEPVTEPTTIVEVTATTVTTPAQLDISDMPENYATALDWVWTNRIENENSTGRWNTIFDQIYGGEGTLNYVVRWQSYKTLTLVQRQKFEDMIETSVNAWTDYLKGYDGWKYDHIDVKIVGWAVIDKSVILDKQPDEIIYTNCTNYDSSGDTSNGREEIPTLLPNAPDELSRMYHYDTGGVYDYPGGLDKRFDMYMWATQGFPDIGGCGGDWGQRLSDNAYLSMLDGTNIHVFEHELGHGFGITDFYGGPGESNGYPPEGFPEPTIMMAGNSMKITNYDGWQLRYIWSKIKDQTDGNGNKRFN